jgi:hypothetical protein
MRAAIGLLLLGWASAFAAQPAGHAGAASSPTSPDPRWTLGELIASDHFDAGLADWTAELERGGSVRVTAGVLEIDVPAGCTVWLKRPLTGPLVIAYEAMAISAGGANDRVSDLNCFWMARDARNPENLFSVARSGRFADYDRLRCYYVGLGGNANSTTRFRRYIGEAGNRPLRPEHDLSAPEFLLRPNVWQRIQLVAAGGVIGFYRDGRRLFELEDAQPYASGWFAFRTVTSHLRIRDFHVHRLVPVQSE